MALTPIPESSVVVRRARADEVPVVGRLAHAIWHAHYPGIITVEQIDYMLARGYAPEVLEGFIGRPDRGLELALVDGEPAGFAAWYVTSDPAQVKLDKLYVLRSRQRQGVGERLLGRVAELARGAGAMELVLNVNKGNVQAIRAYEKHGFVTRASVEVDIGGGFVMDDYVMTKDLGA